LAYNGTDVRRGNGRDASSISRFAVLLFAIRSEMNALPTPLRRLILLASVVAVWTAVYGVALAQEAEEAGGGGGGGGARAYAIPYAMVILGIGVGLLFVCRSAHRRERPKGEEYAATSALADIGKAAAVPVISLGMRMDMVSKLLGKPKIRRRGADIYRELAQAGKLSEDDAAKEYLVYEHPAGRYELVAFDRRVIEIRNQPKPKETEGS
jgi:hypothetical protein